MLICGGVSGCRVTRSGCDVALFLRAWPSSAPTVPRLLAQAGSSSRALRSPPESLGSEPAARLSVRGAFPGVPSLFATSAGGVHYPRGVPGLATFRPRRFSRPRRLAPPPTFAGLFHPAATSRVRSSRVSPVTQPHELSPAVALMSFARGVLASAFRALLQVPIRCPTRGFSPRLTRSLLELPLPRVLLQVPCDRL